MNDIDEIGIVNHENTVPRIISNVTSERIQYYSDVIDMMVKTEVARSVREDNYQPSQDEINFLHREMTRHLTIRADLRAAQNLRIKKRETLL